MNSKVLPESKAVYYDAAMLLPNLLKLEEDLKRAREDNPDHCWLICYDVSSLRQVNHAYGRAAGDELLWIIANWMSKFPRAELYRVEGDLFCLLACGYDQADARAAAQEIFARFARPWALRVGQNRMEYYTKAAVSLLPAEEVAHSEDLTDLFERTLDISRQTKRVALYDEEADHSARERVRQQLILKNCILYDMQGFSLHYQPIVDAISGVWRGLEALCRWQNVELGKVPPSVFIREAEEMGLMSHLGSWVLRAAVTRCKQMHLDELPSFFLSVNVSPSQLSEPGFVDGVFSTLHRMQYPAGKLVLEITESAEFVFNDFSRSAIRELQEGGVQLALDDFGTGYSSFNHLKKISVNYLKTECDFIQGIEHDQHLQFFYYIMSETAHAGGMRLIAEGVETVAQLRSVVKNGADLVQGYFFSPPIPGDILEARLGAFTTAEVTSPAAPMGYMDFTKWLEGPDPYMLSPSLFGVLNQCLQAVLDNAGDGACDAVLEIAGRHFNVKRAFVFLQDEGTRFSNRYEWCADGVPPQKAWFQRVDISADGLYDVLRNESVMLASRYNQLPAGMRHILETHNASLQIHSLALLPITNKGQLLGFVGFDDDRPRAWMPEEIIMLQSLCMLALLATRQGGQSLPAHTGPLHTLQPEEV